ncbi:hypothetical protein Plhal304r1_c018g0064381 [Plasmopara halstedii]
MKLKKLFYRLMMLSTFALLSFYDTEAVELLTSNATWDETHQNSRRFLSTPATHNNNVQKLLIDLESSIGKMSSVTSRIWNRIKHIKLVQKGVELKHRKNGYIKLGEEDKKSKPRQEVKSVGVLKELFLKSLMPSVYLKLADNKSEAIKALFIHYDVGSVTSNIFSSSQFKKWFAVINDAYSNESQHGYERTLEALITTFGKERIYKDLAKAWEDPSAREAGKLLDRALSNIWWFYYRSFKNWYFPTIDFLLDEMEKIGFLYGFSAMLKTAETRVRDVGDYDARITKLEEWKQKNLSDMDLFVMLDFEDRHNKILLTSDELYTWYDFAKLKKGNPSEALRDKLYRQGSEEDVAVLLSVVAKERDHSLGEETLDAVFQRWKKKRTDHQVASGLFSRRGNKDIFNREEMYVFDSYMRFRHKSGPHKLMYEELSLFFGDKFDEMLAKAVERGNLIAMRLYWAKRSNLRLKTRVSFVGIDFSDFS